MPVPTFITDLSATAASNYPAGSDAPSSLDDVQRAHAGFIRNLLDATQTQAYTAFTTAGTTTAYTLTPSPALTALAAGQRFRVKFNAANTSTTPTLAINGLTAKSIKVYDTTGAKADPPVGFFALNMLVDLEYDGTDCVALNLTTGNAKSGANSDITSLSGFAAVTVQTFTSDGTYTKPAGVRNIVVEVQAPGGGGSGAASGDRGNGGAGGGYARKNFLASAVAATEAVTVPAGGDGGGAGANAGVAGATASFGTLLTATGGAGGVIGGATTAALGGIGASGDVNVRGGSGGLEGGSNVSSGGGDSVLGAGAPGVAGSTASQAGGNYGGGGGGAIGAGATARAGGAGAPGIVIVTEFY